MEGEALMQKYQNNIAGRNGDVVTGASVLIAPAGSVTPSTIYSDNGVTPIANPLTTDVNGYFEFYVADGTYDIRVNGSAAYTDVLIVDALSGLNGRPTTSDLAASDGGTKIGTPTGTVQDALDVRPTADELAAAATVPLMAFTAAESQSIFDNALPMQSYTALRAYTGRAVGVRITAAGVAGVFQRDASDATSADNGGTIIADASGRRWKRLFGGAVSVAWFGAKDSVESSDAIQAAFDYVRSTGRACNVDMGSQVVYPVNKPIKGTYNCQLSGSFTLKAVAGFSPITFDVFGGGSLTASPLIYFVDTAATTGGRAGTIGNYSGSRRYGLQIDSSMVLDCDDIAEHGIFLDNYFDYRIYGRVIDPVIGGATHYSNGWGGDMHPYVTGAGQYGVYLGGACNGIDLSGLRVWGDNKIPAQAGIVIDGDNNGLQFSGAFVEKVTKGIICKNGCGPIDISGIDFEQVEEEVVYVDGTSTPTRIVGPVTVASCFLETNSATLPLIHAENAIVITRGNRMRNAALAFQQVGNGHIIDESNMMQSTVLSIGTGRIISKSLKTTRNWSDTSYSESGGAIAVVREVMNNAYPYNKALASSGMQYSHSITDVPTQRMIGRADWFMCDMSGGVEANRMGIRLMYTGGGTAKQVLPLEDNGTTLGTTGTRWSQVYGVLFRPGDGTAIWRTGTGTPEGTISAVVGSLYTRLDGGAGTTLYIKETGAGATGWVAK